jgi:hypothetical protein
MRKKSKENWAKTLERICKNPIKREDRPSRPQERNICGCVGVEKRAGPLAAKVKVCLSYLHKK